MDRTIKVFCTGAAQKELAQQYQVIERYEGFVVVAVSDKQAAQLARAYPTEDITDLYTIRAGERTIETSVPRVDAQGVRHAHPAYKGVKPPDSSRHHYLVQFIGPIKSQWLTAVKRAGGEIRAPYADFTTVVRADEAALKKIAALPQVRWVGHLPPIDRIAPTLLRGLRGQRDISQPQLPRRQFLPGVYVVEFFGSDDLRQGINPIRKLGCKILSAEEKRKTATTVTIEIPGSAAQQQKAITALAHIHGVRAIRERTLRRISNNVASGIMGTAKAIASSGLGLSGKGEYVGVCDTGLDTGDPNTIHSDFTKRVAWIKSYPITADFTPYINNPGGDDGPADLDSGHGTHVAGSVLGSGAGSAGLPGLSEPIRGLAFNAKLTFQAIEQELKWKNPGNAQRYGRYLLAGIPNDLTTLFSDAYRRRVRIHSNSWGGGDPGAYDDQCEQLDRFVWQRKTFCVLVAAGNDGTDNDGDGKINPMSVSSPATAKNCISVGASENRRSNFDSETYGKWWPQDYPSAPFRNDPMANNPEQVVAFSSRGPTQDGRIKPEVVAPGTFILSTRSTLLAPNNKAWAAFPPSKLYFHMGGTSMATPLTAGGVALVREYLRTKQKKQSPTAALLKATLIAGATRLPDTATPNTIVDNHQGFGRVNLDAVLAPPSPASAQFMDVRPGLATGRVRTFTVQIKSNAVPLRIVLAYTDYPGPTLVNNLNLIVTAPDGTRYVGNQAAAGATAADSKNNVEVMQVSQPAAGAWKIEVIASNVPQGPQDFALVYVAHV